MAMQKTAMVGLAVGVVAMALLASVLAVLQANRTFSNTGAITTVGVGAFLDNGCTQVLSTIDWGSLVPGASVNKTVYIKNSGTAQVSLNMTVTAWNPANASSLVSFTWNQEGTALNAGNVLATLLVLSVSSGASGVTNFGFNATITGTQM
jgi:hypothetical protein